MCMLVKKKKRVKDSYIEDEMGVSGCSPTALINRRSYGPLLDSRAGCAEGRANGSRGRGRVPVRASGEDVVAAEVVAGEAKVVVGQ